MGTTAEHISHIAGDIISSATEVINALYRDMRDWPKTKARGKRNDQNKAVWQIAKAVKHPAAFTRPFKTNFGDIIDRLNKIWV